VHRDSTLQSSSIKNYGSRATMMRAPNAGPYGRGGRLKSAGAARSNKNMMRLPQRMLQSGGITMHAVNASRSSGLAKQSIQSKNSTAAGSSHVANMRSRHLRVKK
jgi:hypothetical protein